MYYIMTKNYIFYEPNLKSYIWTWFNWMYIKKVYIVYATKLFFFLTGIVFHFSYSHSHIICFTVFLVQNHLFSVNKRGHSLNKTKISINCKKKIYFVDNFFLSEPSNSSLNFYGSAKFVPQLCEIST